MYFLVDDKQKIIFGWSAKCGCTHIKYLFSFLTGEKWDEINSTTNLGNLLDSIHHQNTYGTLPPNFKDYRIFIIVRNPFKRLVSGFLEKYNYNGQRRHLWPKDKLLSFNNFCQELFTGQFDKVVDLHHFTWQLSEKWNDQLKTNVTVWDINAIDYKTMENIYNKQIPQNVRDFRGKHARYTSIDLKNINVQDELWNKSIDSYFTTKIDYKHFYSPSLKTKVKEFYKKDFQFCESKGFHYNI